jgi:hypothetical protein
MVKETDFRLWLRHMWLANCEEHDAYGEPPYSMTEYWRQYRWFLRTQYRRHKNRPQYISPEIRSIMRPPQDAGC